MDQVDIGHLVSELPGSGAPTELYLVGAGSAPAASALRNAVAHDLSFRKIASKLDLDVELFLQQLVAATARVSRSVSSLSDFSEGEVEALRSANVDLSSSSVSDGAWRTRTLAAMAVHAATARTIPDCAASVGVSAGRLRQRIAEGSLYAFRVDNEWRVPTWEVHDGAFLPGLDAVVPRLDASLHPFAVSRFMQLANPELEVEGVPLSPAEWLAGGGDPITVSELAVGLPGTP